MKLAGFTFPATRMFAPTDLTCQYTHRFPALVRTMRFTIVCLATLSCFAHAQTNPVQSTASPISYDTLALLAGASLVIAFVASSIAFFLWRRLRASASQIRRSELFASIAEHSRDLLTVFDSSGTVAYQSPSIKKILGIDPSESVGKSYLDTTLSTESKEQVLHTLQLAVSGKFDDTDIEVVHERPDGDKVWLESRLHVHRDRGGNIDAIYGISRDVTEKRRTEQTLRETEKRFQMIAAHVTDVIHVYDADGIIQYASPSSERVLGYSAEERIGSSFMDSPVTDKAGKAKIAALLKKIASGEFTEGTMEVTQHHRDGREFLSEVSIRVRRDGSGATEEIYVLSRDITRRHEAEEALRASEERYRRLAEYSIDPFVTVDADGIMIYASPAVQSVWQMQPEQLIGKHFLFAVRHPEHSLVEAAVTRMRKRETISETLEMQHVLPDRSLVWSEVRAWPIFDDAGQFGGIQFLARDITEQRRNRELLVAQNRKLEARTQLLLDMNSRLDRFSASVSHDLRGPVRRITRQLVELRERDTSARPEIASVIAELQDMDELVEHLLNLAVDAERPLERVPVDMGAVALRQAERLELETGRAFTINVPDPGDAVVSADGSLMQLLFSNLIRNACRHVSPDRTLVIDVTYREHDDEQELCVADNGDGFNAADPATLFEYSVRGTDDEATDGYGIGLATVSDIVHRHGGRIVAENLPGGGACIRFTLGGGS